MATSTPRIAVGGVVQQYTDTSSCRAFGHTALNWALLAVGTSIVTRAGPALTVTGVEQQQQTGGFAVYNFVVPGDHTYFVGTVDGGAWVHNARNCDALANTVHSITGVAYDAEGYPIFTSEFTATLPAEKLGPTVSDGVQMRAATRQLRDHLKANPGEKANFTKEALVLA